MSAKYWRRARYLSPAAAHAARGQTIAATGNHTHTHAHGVGEAGVVAAELGAGVEDAVGEEVQLADLAREPRRVVRRGVLVEQLRRPQGAGRLTTKPGPRRAPPAGPPARHTCTWVATAPRALMAALTSAPSACVDTKNSYWPTLRRDGRLSMCVRSTPLSLKTASACCSEPTWLLMRKRTFVSAIVVACGGASKNRRAFFLPGGCGRGLPPSNPFRRK